VGLNFPSIGSGGEFVVRFKAHCDGYG